MHGWWEYKVVHPLWKTEWRFLKTLKTELPYDPATPCGVSDSLQRMEPKGPNRLTKEKKEKEHTLLRSEAKEGPSLPIPWTLKG